MAKSVRITADIDISARPTKGGLVVIAYRAGTTELVPDDHADRIVAAGAGELVEDKTPQKVRG
jgi:hypothetical protein